MFDAGILTFREFAMQEPLPLATIQRAILEFLRGRDDAVIFGAQAVNAYVDEPRMTQDVDILARQAETFADELRTYLSQRFRIAVRVRVVGEGRGYRLFQVRKTGNRHLVDVRPVDELPPSQRIADVLVLAPADLIASKVVSLHQRQGQPKSGTDWRDLTMLLLTFPELKGDPGPVTDRLQNANAASEVFDLWKSFVDMDIQSEDDGSEFS